MKKLSKLIQEKIDFKERQESKGIKNPFLDAEIERLCQIYLDIKSDNEAIKDLQENPIQTLLAMKRMEDEIDFIINKDFNLGKAVKQYADKTVENLKLLDVVN